MSRTLGAPMSPRRSPRNFSKTSPVRYTRPKQASPRPRSPPTLSRTYLNDAECVSMREQVLADPDFSQFKNEQLVKLFSHLRERSQFLALQQDYEQAQRSRRLMETVHQELLKRTAPPLKEEDEEAEKRRKEAFDERWQRNFEVFDEDAAKREEQLKQRQKEELDEFNEMWEKEMPRKYRKPSAKLLQLMKVERSLAITNDFEQAERIHKEVEAVSKAETELAQQNLNSDYRIARDKFMAKQKQTQDALHEETSKFRKILETKYQREKAIIENRQNVIRQKQVYNQRESRLPDLSIDFQSSVVLGVQQKMKSQDLLLPPLEKPT